MNATQDCCVLWHKIIFVTVDHVVFLKARIIQSGKLLCFQNGKITETVNEGQ